MGDNNEFVKQAKRQLRKGDYRGAISLLEKAKQAAPNADEITSLNDKIKYIKTEENTSQRYMRRKEFEKALNHLQNVSKEVTECPRVKFMQVECLTFLNRLEEATTALPNYSPETVDKSGPLKASFCYVKGLMEYFKGNVDEAVTLTTSGKEADSRNDNLKDLHYKLLDIKGQMSEALENIKANEYQKAQIIYSDLINLIKETEPENKAFLLQLLGCRVGMSFELNACIDAASDAEWIIDLDKTRKESYLFLARGYKGMGRLDSAITVLKKGLTVLNDVELKEQLKDLESQQKSKHDVEDLDEFSDSRQKKLQATHERCLKFRRDPRKIANADPDVTNDALLKVIKKMLKEYHPDSFRTDEQKQLANEITIILIEVRDGLKAPS